MLIAGVIAAVLLTLLISRLIDIAGGLLVRRILERRMARRCRGMVVLTYDDGPGTRLQHQLLRLLDEYAAQATFFLLGSRVRENADAVAEIARAGHAIANHGEEHLDGWRIAPWRMIQDIGRGEQVVAGKPEQRLPFRPPLGRLTLSTWLWCLCTGRRIELWTLDGRDSLARQPSESEMNTLVESITRLEQGERLRRGGCVLLHSFDRSDSAAGHDREQYVLDTTRLLLSTARAHNMPIATLDSLSRHSAGSTMPTSNDSIQSAA